MLVRLGNVLYWAGVLISALPMLLLVYADLSGPLSVSDEDSLSILAAGWMLIVYGIGWACRYVLVPKQDQNYTALYPILTLAGSLIVGSILRANFPALSIEHYIQRPLTGAEKIGFGFAVLAALAGGVFVFLIVQEGWKHLTNFCRRTAAGVMRHRYYVKCKHYKSDVPGWWEIRDRKDESGPLEIYDTKADAQSHLHELLARQPT
jgi:hypothetical protein